MTTLSIRIAATDFVTPPEFRGLQLAQRSSGQIGGVRLELVGADRKTRLGRCYQQVPVRVLPPFHFPSEPAALLYLINPTAGLLDGDGHKIEVTATVGTHAVVTGQSATRIHPAVESFATQQWQVAVESGAQLVLLPGPAIPFRGCRYFQRVRIDLAEDAQLIWGDLWLAGRYARGDQAELFQFDHLVQDLEVHRPGRLVFRERFAWQGPWDREKARWYFGEHLASGSLFVTGCVPGKWLPTQGLAQRALLPLTSGDTVIRWCGPPPEVMGELVRTAFGVAGSWSMGTPNAPWLLHSHNFGPNHWFSTALP